MADCTCAPCETPAYGAPGIAHCAACCYGTMIEEYDPDCPIDEHHMLALRQRGLTVDRFPIGYKVQMLTAYPVIAGMTLREAFFATPDEMDVAFGRVLAARNLRRTHEMYLQDRENRDAE